MYYLLSWPDDDEAAASSSRLPRDENKIITFATYKNAILGCSRLEALVSSFGGCVVFTSAKR